MHTQLPLRHFVALRLRPTCNREDGKVKVVLGGSRHLEYVPQEVGERLLEWMEASCEFLVGDAPGSAQLQKGLLSPAYRATLL